MGKLVSDVAGDVRDEVRERYAVRVPEGLRFNVDRGLFRQALGQVLENARKYSAPSAPIEIEAEAQADAVAIRVLDRGSGIRADELARVFEKSTGGERCGIEWRVPVWDWQSHAALLRRTAVGFMLSSALAGVRRLFSRCLAHESGDDPGSG